MSDTPITNALRGVFASLQILNPNEVLSFVRDALVESEKMERENADLRKQLAERSGQCENVERENELLREVLVAGAEELGAHWDAHCDAEGYGPAGLERRMLECLAVSYPGYSVGAFAELRAKLEAAQRDAGRGDPMDNWLMKPALEWLEQAEHGHDNERCKRIAALLRDLWRGSATGTTGDAAMQEGK